ncbi:DNA-3-methyladenine glycosylase III [Trichlorobacter thiogenes]|uniref:DNA-3-methyladenine glycosylase III n=1 Tax=Trichlorobacter thiogenes TaxID=115783 RepID=A0A1T4RLE2_9BACT|nr:endonuclease III domain-containing protein [Trichlorobacter thiogenes]SKA16578.1 DNA-3-methyladenine glycosylase III [Trichlorobacter thiogenes]
MADNQLQELFDTLLAQYGPRHWWPGETPFEVCVGAILTQNTNWGNVEKAIANLKAADRLSMTGIDSLLPNELAALIRPAGYFNVKATRLQAFTAFVLQEYGGSLDRLFTGPWQTTRQELLAVKGIGPETADSILLYAGQKPSFVVDAYTRRIFSRLGLVDELISYDRLRDFFMDRLPLDTALFNEYHALIVELGKQACRPKPQCRDCCLLARCQNGARNSG